MGKTKQSPVATETTLAFAAREEARLNLEPSDIKKRVGDTQSTDEDVHGGQEQFRQYIETIPEVLFFSTLAPFAITHVTPSYEHVWGRRPSELHDRPDAWLESVHPDDRESVLESFSLWRRGRSTQTEFRIQHSTGTLRWIRLRTFPLRDEMGFICVVVGFAEDATARKKAEEEVQLIHCRLNRVLSDIGERAQKSERLTELVDMIQCSQDREQALKIAEEGLASLFSLGGALYLVASLPDGAETVAANGFEAVAVWGQAVHASRVFSREDCWGLRRGKIHVITDPKSAKRCNHTRINLEGGHICLPLVAHGEAFGLLYLEYPKEAIGLALGADPNRWKQITDWAVVVGQRLSLALASLQLREVLRRESVRDPLTGLFNRRFLEEALERELSRASRSQDSVAVAICDLDRFKEFNDVFGHDAGDLVLRRVAAALTGHVRQGDAVCRLGGEEFVIVLPRASVEIARERLRIISNHVQSLNLSHGDRPLGKVTISTGIAGFPEDGSSAEGVLRAADKALYRAKAEGRNRVVVTSQST